MIAWSWIGLSKFEGVIKEELNDTNNYMRSIRLRKGNIQIGGEDTLQNLFAEDRGNHYFIGEVFALDNKLIPNAQRDYFIENPNLKYIEKKLREYFTDLGKIYRNASAMKSAVRKYNTAAEKYDTQIFTNKQKRKEAEEKLKTLKAEADNAVSKPQRNCNWQINESNEILTAVTTRIVEKTTVTEMPPPAPEKKQIMSFPNLRRSEVKLVDKILTVIKENVPAKTYDNLESKIIEAVRK